MRVWVHQFGLLFWGDSLQTGGCGACFLSAASLCEGLCGDTSVSPVEGDIPRSLPGSRSSAWWAAPALSAPHHVGDETHSAPSLNRKTGDQRLRRRRKPNCRCCSLQPGPERSFSEGSACVSSSQRGSGDARGAKTSLTRVPGVGGEGRGWGMARDAEAELATPCCPCELGPVHLSPSQLPQKSAGGFRQAAGAAGRGASAFGGLCSSISWKYGVHPWHGAAPRPAAST